MIRVALAAEPSDFDETVRRPGLSAISELVGQGQTRVRSGRKRAQLKDKAGALITARGDIPSDRFPPLWREQLPNLLASYDRICAYVCVYIERTTGASTVDHMIPKSVAWDHVYEWDNYRLACSVMNSRKGDARDVLDPFEIETGWFHLQLVSFELVPSPTLDAATTSKVQVTIDRLGLNDSECLGLREEYAESYWDGDISLRRLRRRAPFVATELERQGSLREQTS